MVLEAVALFSVSQIISVTNPVYYLYPILAIYGAGVGLAIGQLTSTVLMSVPWQKAGVGSGANNTVRQIGSAFGIAVIGAILVAQISAVGQADIAASTVIPDYLKSKLVTALSSGLSGGVDQSFISSLGPIAPAVLQVFYDAITQGTRWAAFTAGIFVSLGALSSLLIPDPRSKPRAKEAPSIVVPSEIGGIVVVVIVATTGGTWSHFFD